MVSKSGLIEAIGNVHADDRNELLGQLNEIVDELTLELAVATAVRDAVSGRNVHVLTVSTPDPCCCYPAELQATVTDGNGQAHSLKPGRKPTAASESLPSKQALTIPATEKTVTAARMLLKRGALTKAELAKALGWTLNQVAITLGRSKQHFLVHDDGKVLVAPALAEQLEA